jgi:phage tail-like protein
MKSGKTMYFSLNCKEHWQRRGVGGNIDMTDECISLLRGDKYSLFDTIRLDELDEIAAIVQMAVGSMGHLILLDEQGQLWQFDRASRHCERLFVAVNGSFSASGKLAVTGDTIFVAHMENAEGEAAVAAFDIASGQLRWRHAGSQMEGVPLYPLAIASNDSHLFLLTVQEEIAQQDPAEGERLRPLAILKLSPYGVLESVYADETFRMYLSSSPLDREGAASLHAAPDGSVYAFDCKDRRVFRFDASGRLTDTMELPGPSYAGLTVDSSGRMYTGESRFILEGMEDDRFLHQFSATGQLMGPIGSYRGKVDQLVIDSRDRLYVLNRENRSVTVLELQPRTQGWEGTDSPTGVWLSRAFDSAEAETVWHKFTLDADIPDGTMLRISYFSSDSEWATIAGEAWKVDDWIARQDLPMSAKLDGLAAHWSPNTVVNPVDALFFGARGRYLWLKIEWIGSENLAPAIRRMRVYFPRISMLEYLPAVYREQEQSSDFLARYLSLFDTLFDSVEKQIDDMAKHFDPERVAGKQLRWLASWLGLSCDEHWSDEWVRRLIRAAPVLYRYRGTRRGIETLVETMTGRKPIIVEAFQFKAMREQGELKWLTDDLYGDNPFVFTVLMHQEQAASEKERELLRQLIEEFKPAYTQVQILWLQPWMYLDLHTYLGINTMLAEPSLLTLEPGRSMPNDTLIVDRDMDRRLDAHSRLDMDAELE